MGDSNDAPAGKTVTAKWIYRTLLASAALSLAACDLPKPQYPTSDSYKAPPPIPAPQPQYPTTDSSAPPASDQDQAPKAAPTTGVDSQSLPPAEKSPSSWLAPASEANPHLIRASYEVILADTAASSSAKGKPKAKPAAHTPPKGKPEHARALRGSQERGEPTEHAAKDEGETSDRGARTVKVRKGETLDAIARQTGVSKDALIEANGLTRPFHVVAGRTLKIPHGEEDSAGTPRSEAAKAEASRPETSRTETARTPKTPKAYVARPGDTVYALARRFKIAPGEIEAANGFGKDVRLHPGQKVLLPKPPGETEEAAAAPPRHAAEPKRKPDAELVGAAPAPEPRTRSAVAPPAAEAPSSSSQSFLRPYPLAASGPSPNEPPGQPVPYSAMTSTALAAPPQKPLPHANYAAQPTYTPPQTYARPTNAAPAPSASAPSTGVPYASLSPSPRPPVSYPAPTQPYVAPPQRPITPPVEAAPPPTEAEVVLAGRGRFAWPVRGDILSGFGPKPGGQRNDGLDIATQEGSPVHAAASGEVVYAGDQVPGFGNLVLIKHEDGWVTAYAHLSRTEVKIKDRVTQGTEIGLAGESGGAVQPEVHFEIRYAPTPRDKARPVDPALLLNNP